MNFKFFVSTTVKETFPLFVCARKIIFNSCLLACSKYSLKFATLQFYNFFSYFFVIIFGNISKIYKKTYDISGTILIKSSKKSAISTKIQKKKNIENFRFDFKARLDAEKFVAHLSPTGQTKQ